MAKNKRGHGSAKCEPGCICNRHTSKPPRVVVELTASDVKGAVERGQAERAW